MANVPKHCRKQQGNSPESRFNTKEPGCQGIDHNKTRSVPLVRKEAYDTGSFQIPPPDPQEQATHFKVLPVSDDLRLAQVFGKGVEEKGNETWGAQMHLTTQLPASTARTWDSGKLAQGSPTSARGSPETRTAKHQIVINKDQGQSGHPFPWK